MRKYSHLKVQLTLVCTILSAVASIAQPSRHFKQYFQTHEVDDADGAHDHSICGIVESSFEAELKPILEAGIDQLRNEGILASDGDFERSTVMLEWPLRMASTYESLTGVKESYFTMYYADINRTEGPRLDWKCAQNAGARTFDNHNGADISAGPFPWRMLADGAADVVAAAPGQVIWRHDGAYDLNCGNLDSYNQTGTDPNMPTYGNVVALEHSDGKITIYAHLKNGSVANLAIGEMVNTGQYLGKMGSSGRSGLPHLHFEVRLGLNTGYIEPWFVPSGQGGCNTDVPASLWTSQKPYDDPGLLRAFVWNIVSSYNCSDIQNNNIVPPSGIKNHLSPSSFVNLSATVRDQLPNTPLQLQLYNPSNLLLQTFNTSQQETTYGENTILHSYTLPSKVGTYRLRAGMGTEVINHYFTVGCPSTYSLSGMVTSPRGWIASGNINSTQEIGATSGNEVVYESGTFIQFNPGFVANEGVVVRTRIDGCTIGSMLADPMYGENFDVPAQIIEFGVYPNPALDEFTVEIALEDQVSDGRIVIRNSLGQEVASRINGNTSYISERFGGLQLSAGLYFVEFHFGKSREVKKLIVQ